VTFQAKLETTQTLGSTDFFDAGVLLQRGE
jgi:hypothetical protein